MVLMLIPTLFHASTSSDTCDMYQTLVSGQVRCSTQAARSQDKPAQRGSGWPGASPPHVLPACLDRVVRVCAVPVGIHGADT